MKSSPPSYSSRLSGELLLELVGKLPIAAFVVDDDRLYCNRLAENLTGYSNSEVATLTEWMEKILEPVHGDMREHFEQQKAAGFPAPRDFMITCRDGNHRMVEFTATGKEQVYCVMHDVTARIRAEQRLRDSESLLREAQRVGNMGVFEYDMVADIWSSSREMDFIFGVDASYPKTFNGWLAIVHPECRDDMAQYFKAILADVRWFDREYRIIRPCDGLERWVYGNGEFFCDAAGRPVRLIGTIQDITKRKQAERRLIASETKYHNLFNSATDAIFILDLDGRFIDANLAAYTRLGYTKAELLALNIKQLDPPDFASKVDNRLQRVREEGGAVFESAHRRKDGSIMPVEVNCRLHEYDGQSAYFSVIRDISERKQAEAVLRNSEERYRHFSQLTSDYVYSCSRSGDEPFRVKWLAGAIEEITGYSVAEVMALGCWLPFVHPDDRPRFSRTLLALVPGKSCADEFRLVRKDGAVRWISESCSCVQGEAPGELLLFGTSTDITARKVAELRVLDLNDNLEHLVAERTASLEKSNEDLDSFCYAVSHELRAPIARLQGFSSILGEIYKDSAETSFMAARIENASRELQSVVDSILMLSRFSRIELSRQAVDLTALVECKLAQLLAGSPERMVELSVQPGVTAVVDPGMMGICLDNLLANAFKFTGQTAAARIEFGLLGDPGNEVYFLRDNGAGFDMKYADKLYAPFQRLHQQKEFPGTGIGLATVKRIIERHGGEIWAESSLGKGATFYFTLGGKL